MQCSAALVLVLMKEGRGQGTVGAELHVLVDPGPGLQRLQRLQACSDGLTASLLWDTQGMISGMVA